MERHPQSFFLRDRANGFDTALHQRDQIGGNQGVLHLACFRFRQRKNRRKSLKKPFAVTANDLNNLTHLKRQELPLAAEQRLPKWQSEAFAIHETFAPGNRLASNRAQPTVPPCG